MTDSTIDHLTRHPRQFLLAGLMLGFGLGGFFDGILLHQILQWHHLLSGLEEARRDIRILIMTDGIFHLLMYVIAVLGLWLLWRTRAEAGDRYLLGNLLFGFGVWHVVDGVVSHWALGIHRIRMDVENPLFWDLLWLGLFGLLPLASGWLLCRLQAGNRLRTMTLPTLALVTVGAGLLAALPGPSSSTVMVLFRPGVSETDALAAIEAVDGRLVWTDTSRQLWAIDVSGGGVGQLYLRGALWVGSGLFPTGCMTWSKA